MTGKYTFLEDVAIADVAFEATGDTVNDVFIAAAMATMETMVDFKTLTTEKTVTITVTHTDRERLLYEFLEDIIYRKDVDQFLFANVAVTITEKDGAFTLEATCKGTTIDPKKQDLRSDVKAVTLHHFSLTEKEQTFTARVILDI